MHVRSTPAEFVGTKDTLWRLETMQTPKTVQGNNHNKPNLILQYSILIVLSNTFFGRQLERATPAPPSPDAAWTMDNVRYITVLSGYVLVSP